MLAGTRQLEIEDRNRFLTAQMQAKNVNGPQPPEIGYSTANFL